MTARQPLRTNQLKFAFMGEQDMKTVSSEGISLEGGQSTILILVGWVF